jgi:hypothetical protein
MIADFALIILITLFAFYPDRMIPLSHTSLGRLFAVAMIVYYTKIDIMFGLFVCVMTIYYYQMDNFQHMLNISEGFLWDMTFTPYEQHVYDRLNTELTERQKTFRQTNCSKGVLVNKGIPVNNEMAEHVFPELKFDGSACNPCDTTCAFSLLSQKLNMEDELTRPKSSRI